MLTALALVSFAFAHPAHAEALTPEQKKEIEVMIKDWVAKNPATIIESVAKYQQETAEAAAKAQDASVAAFSKKLPTLPGLPTIGKKDADITIVEFYDYNCGYCKKAYIDLQKVIDEDKNIRVIFVDYPILGAASTEAAKWALAADKQG